MKYIEFADTYLNPPIRARYLKNIRASYYGSKEDDECFRDELSEHINRAFSWAGTPEGRLYWAFMEQIFRRIDNGL